MQAVGLLFVLLLCGCNNHALREYTLDRQHATDIAYTPADLEYYQETYPEEEGVYLYREQMVELVPGRSHLFQGRYYDAWEVTAMRYLILDPNAENLTTFELELAADEELRSAYVSVISPDGRIAQFERNDLHVQEDGDGSRTYRLAYPDIELGSVIDVGFERLSNPLETNEFYYRLPLRFSMPVEVLSVRYIYPRSWKMKFRGGWEEEDHWDRTYEEAVDEERGVNVVRYDARNIPTREHEPYAPYQSASQRYLEGVVTRANVEDVVVSTRWTTWEEYAEGAVSYMFDDISPSDREIRQRVEGIVVPEDTPFIRMRKILDQVYTDLRYRRPSAQDEYDPIAALDKGSGSARELTVLTGMMMLNAGLDVDFFLAHSAYDLPVSDWFVSPDVFYHPGLRVALEDSTYYVFPYIRNYPVGRVPGFLQGQPALMFDRRSFGGIDSIPESERSESHVSLAYEIVVEEDGRLHVEEERTLAGEEGFSMRRRLEHLSGEELDQEIEGLVLYEGGDIEFLEYDIEHRDSYGDPLIITMTYELDGLVTLAPEEAILRIGELLSPSFNYVRKLDVTSRQNPIRIYSGETIEKRVVLHLPATWQIDFLPADVREETDFGEARATYSFAPGKFSAEYYRTLRRAEGPASEIDQLARLIGIGSTLSLPTLIFTY